MTLLAADCTGQGPPMVVLHGLFGDKDNLKLIARQFSDRFTVHRLDLPNHGESLRYDGMDFPFFAEQVAAYIANLGEPVILIGHSLGGKTAMRLACKHSEQVSHLIVIDIAPRLNDGRFDDLLKGLVAVDLKQQLNRKTIGAALEPYIKENSIRQFLMKSLHQTIDANGTEQWAWRFNLQAINNHNKDWLEPGIEPNDQFSGRSDFIRGALSDYVRDQDIAIIEKHFPKATVHTVEGAGHWVHAEKPKAFIELLDALLAS